MIWEDAMPISAAQGPFSAVRLSEPRVIANPYPYYDLLRDQSPVFGYRDFPPGTVPGADEPEPSWAVLKFRDVQAVAQNHEIFSSRDSLQESSSAPTLMLVNHDPPEHSRLRKIAARVFLPSSIRALTPGVMDIVRLSMDEFFGGAENGEPVDIAESYCAAVPARVMAYLLGMPAEMDKDVRKWATAFMLSADVSPDQRQASNAEAMRFMERHVANYAAALAAGQDMPGPLLRAFLEADVEGERLSVEEVIRFCMTVTVAGAETTSFLLGNLLCVFSEMPRIWEAYRENTDLYDAIANETLRFHGPPQRLFRVATQDVQLGSAFIRRGDWVACFFGAANYDPDVFPEPYEFRLDRPNAKRQMSFGYGIHRCLGAPLAHLEAEATALVLRERYRRIVPASEPEWQQVSLLNHGLKSYSVTFER